MTDLPNDADCGHNTAETRWQTKSIRDLLQSVNRIILSDGADLKGITAERRLQTGKLKTDRQIVLIESLIPDSSPSLITETVNQMSDDVLNAINSASDSLLKAMRSDQNLPNTNSHPAEHPNQQVKTSSNNAHNQPLRNEHSQGDRGEWTRVVRENRARASNTMPHPSTESCLEPPVTIIGKCSDTELRGKTPRSQERALRTASLYIGNLEPVTANDVKQYIEQKYRSAFNEAIHITKIFPLVKKTEIDGSPHHLNLVISTAFRLVFETSCMANMLNPLIWPANVRVRRWQYKQDTVRMPCALEISRPATTSCHACRPKPRARNATIRSLHSATPAPHRYNLSSMLRNRAQITARLH
jgi:hypothetical protein